MEVWKSDDADVWECWGLPDGLGWLKNGFLAEENQVLQHKHMPQNVRGMSAILCDVNDNSYHE